MGGTSCKIATRVVRRTRYVMLIKIDSNDSGAVVEALVKTIRTPMAGLRRPPARNRGAKMAA